VNLLQEVLLQRGICFVGASQAHHRRRVLGGDTFEQGITTRVGLVHRGGGDFGVGIRRDAHA
jgi:hypothetical protein